MIACYPVPPPDTSLDLDAIARRCEADFDRACAGIPGARHQWEARCLPGSPAARREQCPRCGAPGRCVPAPGRPDDFRPLRIFDEAQAGRYAARLAALRQSRIQAARAAAQAAWDRWYQDYLKSKVWRARKQLVFKRAHGICEACGVQRARSVHHLSYALVGREPLFHLVAVCDDCHRQIHATAL